MSISKPPNVKCYWSVDSYLSNDGVRNAMTRNRFMNILQNLHFADNQTADKSDKAYKMRFVINHLNKAFQDAMSDAERQSVDEHMTKFKGRMSCKQYMKKKPIKWDLKWWCRCCSKTEYLYEFDLYIGKKEKAEPGLGETAVLDLSKKLENKHHMFSLNKLNSATLYQILIDANKIKPASQTYLENLFPNFRSDWKSIYLLPRRVTLDTSLRMFQCKLLNDVLYLNNMLFRFGKVDSPLCSYCNEEEETLLHLFHSCLKTKEI